MRKRKPKKRCPSWCGKQAADITDRENKARGTAQVWMPTGRFYCSRPCMAKAEEQANGGIVGIAAEHMTRGGT